MKHQDIVSKMTLREKVAICSGKDYWHTLDIERLGLPSVNLTDGPHGIRQQGENVDKDGGADLLMGVPATCFPPACATAASWNTELIEEMGDALGAECQEKRVSVLLGPGVNIKRSPLCGRNFEYFSEDPYLTGKMATALIKGVQGRKIGTSIKHFAANNQEARRMTIDTVADERTLREIYLPAFEMAVKEEQPWTIMSSYNRLNGTYTSENKWLLTDVLRKEWGYEGMLVTDWGGSNIRVDGIKAGQDLEMPASFGYNEEKLHSAILSGELAEEALDICVDRIVDMVLKAKDGLVDGSYDIDEHHELSRKIARECIVLLKNEDNILPLKKDAKIAVIGEMARSPRYQGAGSSLVNPHKLDNAFDAFIDEKVNIVYTAGYDKTTDIPDARLIGDAVTVAKNCDVAVIFAGLTDAYESEGFDRKKLDLPANHNALITAVANANPNTVVVLSGGSPVLMPWLSKVKAVVNGYLLGQAGGSATVDILLGKESPSGKLPETYPLALSDCSATKNFPGSKKTVEYREGVYVGYRYYDTFKKDVLFPFGFGLSYSEFKYSGLKLSKKKIKDTDKLTVSFKIKNIGKVDAAEVAQVYVRDVESTIYRPEKELKGFKKVYLKAGEEKTVEIELCSRAFSFWNVLANDWTVESGDFEILVGSSSRDILLDAKVKVEATKDVEIPDYRETASGYYTGDAADISDADFEAVLGRPIPPNHRDESQPLDLTNSLGDAVSSRNGAAINRVLTAILDKVAALNLGGTGDMITAMALELPIRNFVSMSSGVFTADMAEGLLQILNDGPIPSGVGKIIAGLPAGLKNIKNLAGMI
jgi:beta-glucosidase